jgi:hypothetical protein
LNYKYTQYATLQDLLPGVQQPTRVSHFVPRGSISYPSILFKIRFTIILPCKPRSSNWSPSFRFSTNAVHAFSCLPCVLRAPPKTFNATNFCQNNLRETESAKLFIQFMLCIFTGDVYQTLPAVRRLQEGGGCRSPSLHRVRH